MSKLRVYVVVATFYPLVGGIEKQALRQSQQFCERGYRTTIVTFRHDRSWLPYEVIDGVSVMRVAGMLLGRREKLPRLLQKLLYLLALGIMGWTLWRGRRNYDVLHVYQLNLLALPTALACRVTGKPMIIAVRCADSSESAKPQNEVSKDVATSWIHVDDMAEAKDDIKDLERLGKPVVRFTHTLLQRIGAVVVILSSRMQSYLAAHDFTLPDTQLIPNGVDTARFHPACVEPFADERAQVVVCVARLCYQKGIDILLQAWRLVRQEFPQARLILVGNGPLQTQLESLAHTLGIANSVEFAGTQSDVLAQLHRGGIAVLSSRFEGMPNAVLEAMACALPCVATRVSGSEDIISHRVNGLLVEPEDYHSLAKALLTLLGDPRLAQKYGHAARATIEQHYSLEYITDLYIQLYQRITDHRWQIIEKIP